MRLTVFSIALLLLVATSSAEAKRRGKKKDHSLSKHKVTQDADGSSLITGGAHRKRAGHKGKHGHGHKSLSGTVEGLVDSEAVRQAAVLRRARRMGRRLQSAAAYHSASAAAAHPLSEDPPIPYQPGPWDTIDPPYFHHSLDSGSSGPGPALDSSAHGLRSLIDSPVDGDLGIMKRQDGPSSRRAAQLYDGNIGFGKDGGGSGSEDDFPFDSYSSLSEDEISGGPWDSQDSLDPFKDGYFYYGDDMYSFENPDADLSLFHEHVSDAESDTFGSTAEPIPPFPADPSFWIDSGSETSDWDDSDVEETTIADAASRFSSASGHTLEKPIVIAEPSHPTSLPHSVSNLPVVDTDSSDAVEDFFLKRSSDSAAHAAAGAAGVAPPEAAAWEATLQLEEPSLAEVGHEHLHSASAELEVDGNLWEIEGSPAEIALALRVLADRTAGHVATDVHVTLSGPENPHATHASADPSGAASPGQASSIETAMLENQLVLAAKIERLTLALDRTLNGLKRFVWWHGITLITFGAILLIVTALYLLGHGGHSGAEPLLDRPLCGSRNKSLSSTSASASDGEGPGPGDVVLCPQKSLPRLAFTRPLVKVTSFTPDMRSAGFPTPGAKAKLSSWVSWPRSFISRFSEYRSASAGPAEGRVPLQVAESARDHNEELFESLRAADLLGGGSPCDSDEDDRSGGKAEAPKA